MVRLWPATDQRGGIPQGGQRPIWARRRSTHDQQLTLLDTAFILPGTNVRFGFDALIGLIPGIGDAITTAISLYIVREAHQLGAPFHVILRMLANVALDGFVGAVPVVGDAFDVMWRANRRNVRLLREWLAREDRSWARDRPQSELRAP
jgi:Domain of unknown function (DUF4112)